MSRGRTSRWARTEAPARTNVRCRPAGARYADLAARFVRRLDNGQGARLVHFARVHLGIADRHVHDHRNGHREVRGEARDDDLAAPAVRRSRSPSRRCPPCPTSPAWARRRPGVSISPVAAGMDARAAALTFPINSSLISISLSGRERGRFLDEVDRARVERVQHLLAGLAGDADDDDRHRPARHLGASRKPTPSSSGMFRSQVTTSGLSSSTRSSASRRRARYRRPR